MTSDATPAHAEEEEHADEAGRLSLARLGRDWPRLVLGLWLVLCALLAALAASERLRVEGDLDGLLPVEHRVTGGEPWLLLTLEEQGRADQLLSAAALVSEHFGPERVPLAPPSSEVAAWLAGHALYLLPASSHDALRDLLSDEAIGAAVQSLRARLSSPLFGVSGEGARRDPLGLRDLVEAEAGELGHVRVDDEQLEAPEVTPSGDLLAASGRRLLIQLETEREIDMLRAEVEEQLADLPVRVTLLGKDADIASARRTVEAGGPTMLSVTLAVLIVVLALALRRARPVLAVIPCLATGAAVLAVMVATFDMLSLPFIALLLGFGCEGALRLQRISQHGWPAAAVLATALAPLWLSPYPQWRTWTWTWLVGFVVTIVIIRLVLPALLTLLRSSVAWPGQGFALTPMPMLAVLLSLGLLGGGSWASTVLQYEAPHEIPRGDARRQADYDALDEFFFSPNLIAEARSFGEDPAGALERAAVDARLLADLVPTYATRIDSPGSFVVGKEQLDARRASLAQIGLRGRMTELHEALEARSLRADAFGEFLRSASDLDAIPSTEAALEGPLGDWLGRYVEDTGERTSIRSFVELPADPDTPVPSVQRSDGDVVTLRGPVVAARHDRASFGDWLGIYTLCALWVGALLVWLGTRSLAIAVSAAFTALAAQSGLLVAMVLLGMPMGPHLLPAFLLVGAAAVVASARACRAIDLQRPVVAASLLATSTCQIAAGLALMYAGEPLWQKMGLVITLGCALASGTGFFIAPGFCAMLRRFSRHRAKEQS